MFCLLEEMNSIYIYIHIYISKFLDSVKSEKNNMLFLGRFFLTNYVVGL